MCGIFGYLGHKNATTIVFNGLKRLDYRGYDSWGIGALDHNHQLLIEKYVGKITKKRLSFRHAPNYAFVTNEALLELPCDVLAPAALENQLTERNAQKIQTSVFSLQ